MELDEYFDVDDFVSTMDTDEFADGMTDSDLTLLHSSMTDSDLLEQRLDEKE